MKQQLTILFFALAFSACGQTIKVEEIQKNYESEKYQETIALCNKVLPNMKSSDVNYEKIIQMRLNSYMVLQDFKSAIPDYVTAIKIDSTNIQNYVGLAYANWSLENYKDAISAINKAYQISPTDPVVLGNLSYCHGQYGNYKESIEFADGGLNQSDLTNESKAVLLNNRGFALLGLKKYDEAMKDINESINLNGDNSFAFCYRALVNIGLNKMETVCSDLEKSKSLGGETLTKDLINKYCKK